MFWHYYNHIATLMVLSQLVFLVQTFRNYRYAIKKSARQHNGYRPRTLLTVPCKGIDNNFEENITSFFKIDHENFYLCFVVADTEDPAYAKLCSLRDKLSAECKALDIRIAVAGTAAGCSQKIHNLLYSYRNSPEDVDVFAFADSDASVEPRWLSHLLYPLRKSKNGASTGYRWFVPSENNLASLALSAINAKIAQLLGNTMFNQAWGGSMAIRAETFRRINIDQIWQKAISDDLSLSYAVKQAHMKVVFAPGCLVASSEKTSWVKLFEFIRRQFLITRVTIPRTWVFGLSSSVYSLAGSWGGTLIAVLAALGGQDRLAFYATVPVLFLAGQICRSILRQKMAATLLPADAAKLRPAAIADILGNCIWSWFLLVCIIASAFGRTIIWRGISYKLIGPTETIIIDQKAAAARLK
ncbi:MAG: glycosyltransferase [Planctomycetota bacterium]|jgi:cellulose synthase/poly-beta-1,6-N-acetylglucosamine synthase-like glycosyltransferase